MNCIVIGLATGALITGFAAAYYWYRASAVEFPPGWYQNIGGAGGGYTGGYTPGGYVGGGGGGVGGDVISGAMMVLRKSSGLNKAAALWTAASVLLSAASSIASALSGH